MESNLETTSLQDSPVEDALCKPENLMVDDNTSSGHPSHNNSFAIITNREEIMATPIEEWMNFHPQLVVNPVRKFVCGNESVVSEEIDSIVEILTIPYHNFRIRVFMKPDHFQPRRYFYEPIVLLNPLSMFSHKDQIYFNVQMWNEEIEAKVIDRLKNLPGHQSVQDFNVQVIDYEQVQLVVKTITDKYKLPGIPVSYRKLDQNLKFSLLCNSKESAEELLEEILMEPQLLRDQLALECKISPPKSARSTRSEHWIGLQQSFLYDLNIKGMTTNGPAEEPSVGMKPQNPTSQQQSNGAVRERKSSYMSATDWIYMVLHPLMVIVMGFSYLTLQRRVEGTESLCRTMSGHAHDLKLNNARLEHAFDSFIAANKAVIPVFSASGAVQDSFSWSNRKYVTYLHHEIGHRDHFDANTGLFTAQQPGVYLFLFNAQTRPGFSAHAELLVNGTVKASADAGHTFNYDSMALSSVVRLSKFDQVGVFLREGKLFDNRDMYTHFSGILLSH